MRYFINIDYEEGQGQDSYRWIEVTTPDDYTTYFDTGDFEDDWNEMSSWIRKNTGDDLVLHSSSVDDFFYEEPQKYLIFGGK